MAPSEKITVTYEGADPDVHVIDAALYAQALMGFAELTKISYRVLNPLDDHTVTTRVDATRPGSFVVELVADLTLMEKVSSLFTTREASAMAAMTGITGLTIVSVIQGAIKLVKWIGGRSHTQQKSSEGMVSITVADGGTVNVALPIYQAATSREFLQAAEMTLRPLDDPSYSSMSVAAEDGVRETVTADDRGFFSPRPEVRASDETVKLAVAVETAQLSKDSNSRMWVFRSGTSTFTAKMLDFDFIDRVESGAVKLGGGVEMLVDYRVQTFTTGREVRSVTKVYQIIDNGHPELAE